MKVLILGGTGSMGVHLTNLLSSKGHEVFVTSRSNHADSERIKYLKGNARDMFFLAEALRSNWDVIIDFMAYGTQEFKSRIRLLLDSSKQYVFLSSARVYSESYVPITEETPRLLEVSTDEAYLQTDEYALAKARQENLLRDSGRKNWTVIRPSITFSEDRLQLGVLEKEAWLYRALQGRSIVFSNDIGDKITTMTYGLDVAKGIASVVGNEEAVGEVFHITSKEFFSWNVILGLYLDVLERHLGKKVKAVILEKSPSLKIARYQVIYSRYFNRRFDNTKIREHIEVDAFESVESRLRSCLEAFLKKPTFLTLNWRLEAINDRAAGEYTPLGEIPGLKNKVIYSVERCGLSFALEWASRVYKVIR